MSIEGKNDLVFIDSDSNDGDQEYPLSKKQRTGEETGPTVKSFLPSSSDEEEANVEPQGSSSSSSLSSSSSSDSSESTLSSGERQEVISNIFGIPHELILETRRFLKENGSIKFLEKYLPTTATSEDILKLIVQLGYIPRGFPDSETPLFELIKLLHQAMKSIKSLRPRLPDFYTVEHVLDKLESANKILVITGAGISTSLGIPDFRSSKGFYARVQHMGLTDPQEVFDLDMFHSDPSLFYSIAYLILPPEKVFTPLHSFIKKLQDKGKLLRNYTQNIDDIESHVGLHRDKVIQCHGSFATASCVTCGFQVNGEKIFPQIRSKDIPYCSRCYKTRTKLMNNDDAYIPESYGVMKPDITFFGEPLPRIFHQSIREDLQDCDLVLSIGTSLKVSPVADIVGKIDDLIPQVLINKDPISHCNFDVNLLGYCDDVACYLCHELGSSWRLEHGDFDEIVGDDNLNVNTIDREQRLFQIINKKRVDQIIAENLSEGGSSLELSQGNKEETSLT
ncbi:uncharacterized protein PRCAT00006120001 [Priceomyces carsonii]|uniref:uncharacterized protein n=1 Tax=Priceomyces carsonii TaxID=28549 RepID=UPI002ED9B7B7|nr:unnamed protein product [Priceomyces carsonii]